MACQFPLSRNFPSKNTGVGCHAPLQGITWSRDWTHVSCVSNIAGRFFTAEQLGNQINYSSVSSVHSFSHVQLCDSMDCSIPGLPVHHQLLEFTQTHVHWVSGATQSSHPLLLPSPPSFNLSQHQGLFQGVCSLHPVAKVLGFQPQHQSFQWTFRIDFL